MLGSRDKGLGFMVYGLGFRGNLQEGWSKVGGLEKSGKTSEKKLNGDPHLRSDRRAFERGMMAESSGSARASAHKSGRSRLRRKGPAAKASRTARDGRRTQEAAGAGKISGSAELGAEAQTRAVGDAGRQKKQRTHPPLMGAGRHSKPGGLFSQ